MSDPIAFIDSPVGVIRLTQTGDFISSIHYTQQGEAIEKSGIFPTALLKECAAQLSAYFNGNTNHFSFPFQQKGTEFQQRVWQQLLSIPFGGRVSYHQMAVKLGDAKCIRAAGTANGKNCIAIVVPCHRVIGADGSLTGYAGGLWRKQWLLEHEAKLAYGVQTLF